MLALPRLWGWGPRPEGVDTWRPTRQRGGEERPPPDSAPLQPRPRVRFPHWVSACPAPFAQGAPLHPPSPSPSAHSHIQTQGKLIRKPDALSLPGPCRARLLRLLLWLRAHSRHTARLDNQGIQLDTPADAQFTVLPRHKMAINAGKWKGTSEAMCSLLFIAQRDPSDSGLGSTKRWNFPPGDHGR